MGIAPWSQLCADLSCETPQMVDLVVFALCSGTEMGKLKMWLIQVKKFLILCGMEGKEDEGT